MATAEMERRRNKIAKRGARLVELHPVRRHRLRIQAKKLRYSCEFFGSAFPGKRSARRHKELIAALERLQDTLGDLNDISVHEGLAERLADTRQSGYRASRTANKAFAAGRLSGREEARIASALKNAERAYARFVKAKPFW
jgi:CHAD domain-containing protein